MLRLRRLIVVCLLALAVFPVTFGVRAAAVGAKPQDITTADLKVDLLSGGQAEVSERYEISTAAGFRRFQIDVPAPLQGQMLRYELDVAKFRGNEPEPGLFTEIERYDEASGESRAPFSYETTTVSASRQRLTITGKFDAGRWLFRMRYTLKDAVLQSDDKAIFRLYFFPSAAAPNASGGMTLTLPSAPGNDHRLYFVCESPVAYSFDDDRTFTAVVKDMRSIEAARVFLSVPATVFANLSASPDSRSAEQQIEAARNAADRAGARGVLLKNVAASIPVASVVALFVWLLYYLYFEREGKLRAAQPDYALWPSRIPPALLAMLLGRQKLGPLILSTLLRLTNLRTLKMEGFVFTWKDPERVDFSRFTSFEVFLLHWFFGEITGGDPAASAIQVRTYAKNKKQSQRFEESVKQMETELARSFANMRLLDRKKSWYASLIGFVFGIAITVSALVIVFLTRSVYAYLLLVPGVLFIWSSRGLKHLNEEGLKRRTEARTYRDNLDSMPAIFKSVGASYSEIEAVIVAVPRAVALGKTESFLDGLRQLSPRRYIVLAQALLKIYDNQEPPAAYDRDEEYARCVAAMNKLKTTLTTSLSILQQVFR